MTIVTRGPSPAIVSPVAVRVPKYVFDYDLILSNLIPCFSESNVQ